MTPDPRMVRGVGTGVPRSVMAAYFALAAALLLLVIAVASGANTELSVTTSEAPAVPQDVADFLYTFGLILWVVSLPVGVALLLMSRGPGKRLPHERGLMTLLAVALAAGGVSLLLANSVRLDNLGAAPGVRGQGGLQGVGDPTMGANDGAGGGRRNARFRWEVVVGLIAAAGVGTTVIVLRGRRRGHLTGDEQEIEAIIGAIDLAIGDLARERDPRRAVILAFGRFEQMLAARKIPRHPHETPVEYVARVLRGEHLEAVDVEELVGLFQLARFSQARIDEPMKDKAIGCLQRIRDDLGRVG